jgi:hypothetical protein
MDNNPLLDANASPLRESASSADKKDFFHRVLQRGQRSMPMKDSTMARKAKKIKLWPGLLEKLLLL